MNIDRMWFFLIWSAATVAVTAQVAQNPNVSVGSGPPLVSVDILVNAPGSVVVRRFELPKASGETTVTLELGGGSSPRDSSRVSVPPGETLHVLAKTSLENAEFSWRKDGVAMRGATSGTLAIVGVSANDAGNYECMVSVAGSVRTSASVDIAIGPLERLVNLSVQGFVGPGRANVLTAGFVVSAGARGKKLIIRAVGPSLAQFGVASPLEFPVLEIFNRDGDQYLASYNYSGDPKVSYSADLADSLARCGAFIVPSGTSDVVMMMPFAAGSYTARISGRGDSTGAVLFELFEVP